ncbi:Sialidase precursor [Maioricimonas rarisocia]|uniref:Sialidase n=1 Tax=Maioricimonas rarisocia TaxID=2528026 RepID=A0A517ZF64_9PLAN|nr:sialidase family protein [Maioricimonas rarisocia]QDU41104.1 Sialidase precursor [Maioricimonas rarisocia]
MRSRLLLLSLLFVGALFVTSARADEPHYAAELIFPLDDQHNHAPGIAELSNGDLVVSWYRGSGERRADDVAVYGSRRLKGSSGWSAPFLMADTPGFPDCNTCLMVDRQDRLWLFWPVILANTWESCLTHYKVSTQPIGSGPVEWYEDGMILLKPGEFHEEAQTVLDQLLGQLGRPLTDREQQEVDTGMRLMKDPLYRRLGWQPRCKPTVLPSGRILLPLYSDTYSFSIMAISDDDGATWYASKPLIGFGAIQPAVLRRDDGTLVAYMRENGVTGKIRVAESRDDGLTWGPVGTSDLPNPGSGLDGVRLQNGNWVLVYNDTTEGRHSLAVSLSEDGGKTWIVTRHLEQHEPGGGQYHYPAIIQTRDGRLHCVYSYFVDGGKSMKHAEFSEAWIRAGDK